MLSRIELVGRNLAYRNRNRGRGRIATIPGVQDNRFRIRAVRWHEALRANLPPGLVINIRDQYAIESHLATFVKRSVEAHQFMTSVTHFVSSGCNLRRRSPQPNGGGCSLSTRTLTTTGHGVTRVVW